ncbi:BadF/BadG/BcrA/BcrD ATPase family protein [Labedella populi]|nr:BadF/BadG/BcrA/BcrD ATPase family protein [Labedella populi]
MSGGVIAGLDVGGTKAHLLAVGAHDGDTVVDRVVSNRGWTGLGDLERRDVLARMALEHFAGLEVTAMVAGVHGSDSPEQQRILTSGLAGGFLVAEVVNDSELILPAGGRSTGTGVVAGTGSSATSRTADGSSFTVGGWGWALGDDGGAVAIVRDAARSVLEAADALDTDLLVPALLNALDVGHPHDLGHLLASTEPTDWAVTARAVFEAAEQGSPRAVAVIEANAAALADLLGVIRRRGGDISIVVAGGGVMTGQPSFYAAFRRAVEERHGDDAQVALLSAPPVVGAVALARDLVDTPTRPDIGRTP